MSLEYRNEEPQTEEVEQETENYQRATVVVPVYSIVLIASLVVVFLCQLYADSLRPIIEGINNSVFLAGFVKPFFSEGQYWRILTGAALHGGLIHLAFNSYALYVLGKLIETLSNRAHLAIIFLLSVIGGGILSLIFIPEIPSIGASGGVIGFLGYLTVYGFKRRKLLPDAFLKNMLFNVAFIAFIGIFVMSNILITLRSSRRFARRRDLRLCANSVRSIQRPARDESNNKKIRFRRARYFYFNGNFQHFDLARNYSNPDSVGFS